MANRFRTFALTAAGALLLAGPVLGAPPAGTTNQTAKGVYSSEFVNSPESMEVTGMLEQLQRISSELQRDTEALTSFRTPQRQWRTHAEYLNQVKANVNQAGELIEGLNAARPNASPWQQQAIDRITPVAAQLAGSTEAAIQELDPNGVRRATPPYREHVSEIADRAAEMNETVQNFLDYGKVRQKLSDTQRQLHDLESVLEIERG